MTSARAPSLLARAILSRMKSSTAGLIVASTLIQSTCEAAASLFCANAEFAAAIRIKTMNAILSAFTAHLFHDFFDVFPDEFLVAGVPEQVRRVERRHQLDPLIGMP